MTSNKVSSLNMNESSTLDQQNQDIQHQLRTKSSHDQEVAAPYFGGQKHSEIPKVAANVFQDIPQGTGKFASLPQNESNEPSFPESIEQYKQYSHPIDESKNLKIINEMRESSNNSRATNIKNNAIYLVN